MADGGGCRERCGKYGRKRAGIGLNEGVEASMQEAANASCCFPAHRVQDRFDRRIPAPTSASERSAVQGKQVAERLLGDGDEAFTIAQQRIMTIDAQTAQRLRLLNVKQLMNQLLIILLGYA